MTEGTWRIRSGCSRFLLAILLPAAVAGLRGARARSRPA